MVKMDSLVCSWWPSEFLEKRAWYSIGFSVETSKRESGSQTHEQHGLYSTLCCLKNHTVQEQESLQGNITQQCLRRKTKEGRIRTEEQTLKEKSLFFCSIEKTKQKTNMKHTSRLNYVFFLFFFFFCSNKMSYVRIIICIIYNIQCVKIPLTNNTEVWYRACDPLHCCVKLPFYIRSHVHLDCTFWLPHLALRVT